MNQSGTISMDLPDGWIWTRLGDIAQINLRDPEIRNLSDDFLATFLPMASIDAEKGIVAEYEVRPLSQVRKGFTPFSEGDVLFAKITPSMENGKAAIAYDLENGRGFGSTEFHVLSPRKGILSEWLFYFIHRKKFRSDGKANFAGTAGQLRVPADFIRDYPIPLAPLPEQHRIVARIEELFSHLDAGVQALQKAKAQLQRYRQAVLKAAVEGRLTEDWRKAHPEPEPAEELPEPVSKDSPKKYAKNALFELPSNWIWITLGNLIAEGPQNGLYLPQTSYGSGIPILRIDDFQDNCSRSSNQLRLVNASFEDIEKYNLKDGDLVINRVNSPSHLGKCLLVSARNLPAIFESNMMRLQLSQSVYPQFIVTLTSRN